MGLFLAWPAAGDALPHQPGPTSLTQADPAQMLVVLVFLPPPPPLPAAPPCILLLLSILFFPLPPPPPPPPPLPAVAKLHQKTPLLCVNCSISTICQVEGSHPAGSSRMPPREKHNLLAGSLAPRAYLGAPVYAPQPQSHVLKHTAALGRVLACGSTLLTLLGQGLQIPLPPLPRPMTPESCWSL